MPQNTISQILAGALRSKTININAVVTAGIIWYASSKGISLSPEEAVAYVSIGYALLNFVLRGMTNQSLPAKGVVVQNPMYAPDTAGAIAENAEVVDRLATAVLARLKERMRERVKNDRPA